MIGSDTGCLAFGKIDLAMGIPFSGIEYINLQKTVCKYKESPGNMFP